MEFFSDVFQYGYLSNALAACILSGITCGLIGTYVVCRRMVFLAGGITHASFGGLGIAFWAGTNPIVGAWIFAASGLLSMALEAIGFYFAFCFSACGADPLKEIVSLFAQLLAIAMKLGWPFLSLLGAFVAWRLCRRSALNRLKRMQGANEEVADGLSVCTAITGAPGIDKTKMMTSIAVDLERSQREAAFSIIKKYASAFPW